MDPGAPASGVSSPAGRRLTAEHAAARALINATTFDEAVPQILEAICAMVGWDHGALWVVDHEADVLHCAQIWTAPSAQFPEFDAISRQTRFPRGVGLPGRVWETGEPAWIPDVVRDSNFPRAAVADREGLHAAFGFPVLLHGEVLSVMEFFSSEIQEIDADLLSTLTTVGNQIGMFIGRRRAQEELDRFFKLSLDMLCIAGFDGYFKRVNPVWQRVLGWTEAELLAQPYLDLVHPDDREATIAEAEKLTQGAEVIHFENRFRHKDGTVRWLLWASTPFAEQRLVYAAARDITERKAAEHTMELYARDLEIAHGQLDEQASSLSRLVKELEISKLRAEQAADAKSAFLANMSHEIRTPLNAIVGMTALTLKTRLSAEQQEYLQIVKSSAEALLTVINDILDFSKIEARRLDLDETDFDLRETVGNAAKLLALRAAEKGIELAYDVAPDVPQVLVGDPGRLRQVLLNVIGNAVKFTARGEVVVRVVLTEATADHATLQFTVADTGIGIPRDKQEEVFEAFTQADESTTRRFGGTGLGLAIARRLVELMRGRIWVESIEGQGSTFYFTAGFGRSDTSADALRPTALEGLRVLVVDDNATNRRILKEMLESWRMTPVTVADASSAMAALGSARDRFHAVITDCQMPDVDGFTLAGRIKHDRTLRNTPIIMLTSVGRPETATRARKMGIDACLDKPVKHSDLLDALSSIVGVATRRSTPGPLSDTPARQLHILIAEDNVVNRKLVTTLMQKRGHRVEAVENGREALSALKRQGSNFDVILMDVQMPEMGGFETARAIRTHEGSAGPRVPIIALTAHAMSGDLERCFEAGMDGYLTKPIDVDDLIVTVERFADAPAVALNPSNAEARSDSDVFDEKTALKHTGGDRKLLKQIVTLFMTDSATLVRRIKRALDRKDGEAVRLSAHALKGSIATIGSPAGRDAAAALEQLGRASQFEDAPQAYARLLRQLELLEKELVTAGLTKRKSRRSGLRPRRRTKGKQ
jgi:two-component system sensor histidine kinase/response regulator